MTYEEYLKSQGASAEDIAALTTGSFSGAAKRAFDKLQADLAAAAKQAADAEAARVAYKDEADKWFSEKAVPEYQKMEREATLAKANEARLAAAIKSSQDEGLKAIAKEMGYTVDGAAPPDKKNEPTFDASKFVTMDSLKPLMDGVGENLATLEDMVGEHMQLFPNQRLSVRELRREAVAAGKQVYDYWQQKYNVPAARTAAEAARQKAHDDALIAQGEKQAQEKFVSLYGNPDTRPLSPSTSPFAIRKDTGRDAQPWERKDDASTDRVTRATKHVVELATKTA